MVFKKTSTSDEKEIFQINIADVRKAYSENNVTALKELKDVIWEVILDKVK